jgi:hypothetical protein
MRSIGIGEGLSLLKEALIYPKSLTQFGPLSSPASGGRQILLSGLNHLINFCHRLLAKRSSISLGIALCLRPQRI